MSNDEDDFLSRWSRRKRAVAREEPRAETELQSAPVENIPEPETEEDEAAILERLGLPAPEGMSEGDDFSGFMKAGVPEFLRKRALRVLWRSNPVLANLDGLNDYDEDFNAPELTQKVLATGYQVGRGFVKKVLEADVETEVAEPDEAVAEIALTEDETLDSQEVSAEPAEPEPAWPEEAEDTFRPRRMRFET